MSESVRTIERHQAGEMRSIRATVLGIAVDFCSNDADVLAFAAEIFGAGPRASAPVSVTVTTMRADAIVSIIVDDATAPGGGGPIRHVVEPDGLHIAGTGCVGRVVAADRTATAVVSTGMLHARQAFGSDVLEALVWGLVTRLDRQPLHAAALARHDAVLLLCGRSGAGKSTLALAAETAGMNAVTDDIAFLQADPAVRVWTRAASFHVLPRTADSIAIHERALGMRTRHGITKIAVRAGVHGTRCFERAGLCILGERAAAPVSSALAPEEVFRHLDLHTDPGFDVFAGSIEPVVRRISRGGAWLLRPSADPFASVPLLADMLRVVVAGGAA